jgi:hypothetical protein
MVLRTLEIVCAGLAHTTITQPDGYTFTGYEIAGHEGIRAAHILNRSRALDALAKATGGITDVPAALDVRAISVLDRISARHTLAFVRAERRFWIGAICRF